jgi:cell division protein ZapA (FtsZ GTPase activity inhibitor)
MRRLSMALTRSGAKKILLYYTLIQGVIVLLLAASFAWITAHDASVMKKIVTEYAASVALDKGRSAVSSAGTALPSKDLMEKLFAYGRTDARILSVILFSKTSDDNFFKVSARIDLGTKFTLPDTGQKVREATEENWLKKGLYAETIDSTLYADKGKTLYWHNAYIPVKCRDGSFVVRVTVSATEPVLALHDYFSRTAWLKKATILITALLLIASIAASALFLRNFTLLIAGLTGYVKKAVGGERSLSLSDDVDEELSELALSFNTLVGELREKDRTIRDIQTRERAALDAALETKDEESRAKQNAAVTELQQKLEKVRAEKEKIEAEQNRSDEISEIFRRGVDMLKNAKYEEAAAVFTALTILKPDGFGGYFNLGVASAKLGKFTLALDMFDRALAINPNHTHTAAYIDKVRRLRDRHGNA